MILELSNCSKQLKSMVAKWMDPGQTIHQESQTHLQLFVDFTFTNTLSQVKLCVWTWFCLFTINTLYRRKRQHRHHQTLPCIDWKLLRCVIVLNFSAIMKPYSCVLTLNYVVFTRSRVSMEPVGCCWSNTECNKHNLSDRLKFSRSSCLIYADSKTSSISVPISTCLIFRALKLPKVTGLRVLLHRSVSLFTCL